MPQNKKIIYVTRYAERAHGMAENADFVIVSNKDGETLDTPKLLEKAEVKKLLSDKNSSLLVFKNNSVIEEITKNKKWDLLNPPAELAEKIENKITQVEWLGELASYLPKNIIAPLKEIKWQKETLVVQFAHSHSGDGTIVVNSSDELKILQDKFPDRPVRASSFLIGPSFTVNIIANEKDVLVGNISYQITGLPPFTDNLFTTIGNDWGLTYSILTEVEIMEIETLAMKVGQKMKESGWKGLFGIDIMKDDTLDKIFLIEVNARQPASTSFESILQLENRKEGVKGLTTFEAHLRALQGQTITDSLILINDGSQIIQRITGQTAEIPKQKISKLQSLGYTAISYSNTEHNTDLLRIQNNRGIMETHGKFNKRGKEIIEVLE